MVVVLETIKAVCRLILMRLTNSRPLLNPPLPEREIIEERTEEDVLPSPPSERSQHSEAGSEQWTMPRTSLSLPPLPSSEDISSYLLSKVLTADDIKPPKTLLHRTSGLGEMAEILYLVRPVIYAAAMAYWTQQQSPNNRNANPGPLAARTRRDEEARVGVGLGFADRLKSKPLLDMVGTIIEDYEFFRVRRGAGERDAVFINFFKKKKEKKERRKKKSRAHPLHLIVGEDAIARIGTIIHIIMNRIPRRDTRTTILQGTNRAAIRAGGLHGRVVDQVAVAAAAVALERMQQTEPVARLVHGRLAEVVAHEGTAWHGGGVDVAAVHVVEFHGGPRLHGGRERAGPQRAAGELRVEVQVQGLVGAGAEGLLGVVHGTAVADGPGQVLRLVQGADLAVGHLLRVRRHIVRPRDDVDVHGDLECGGHSGPVHEGLGGARSHRAAFVLEVQVFDRSHEVLGSGASPNIAFESLGGSVRGRVSEVRAIVPRRKVSHRPSSETIGDMSAVGLRSVGTQLQRSVHREVLVAESSSLSQRGHSREGRDQHAPHQRRERVPAVA
ncbi:hypothetical protein KC356_g131 [Hortaea werneckii]|nr:hypothetical protein KC356_g131 [Hortaea werneckii]